MALPASPRALRRYVVASVVVSLVLGGAAIWFGVAHFEPTPPREVGMAVDPGDISAELGKRYAEALAADGIKLRLVPTAGAVESVDRLRDRRAAVSIAVIPGGITDRKRSPDLVSLGTLFYEPLWIFYRKDLELTGDPRKTFQGRRIAIGAEDSGAHALSLEFLARAGIIDERDATLLPLATGTACDKLLAGEIDAAVLLDAWESPFVRRMLSAETVEVASIRRADAFVALYPFLNQVVLPAGVSDMANNRPPANVTLLAPKASLIVRRDLHPAIQYLFLEAMVQAHGGPGLFRKEGQFPAPEAIDLPLSDEAAQYYKSGRPFLQRHLPFWIAVLVQQLLLVLIPVVAVVYPLLKSVPALYVWAMRRRVYRLYGELRLIEDRVMAAEDRGREVGDLIDRLDRLEAQASRLRSPVAFRHMLYEFRQHIAMVRERLERR